MIRMQIMDDAARPCRSCEVPLLHNQLRCDACGALQVTQAWCQACGAARVPSGVERCPTCEGYRVYEDKIALLQERVDLLSEALRTYLNYDVCRAERDGTEVVGECTCPHCVALAALALSP